MDINMPYVLQTYCDGSTLMARGGSMSDGTAGSDAWVLTPDAYLAGRPASGAGFSRSSVYVPMRDGVRLAVDIFLPAGNVGLRWPTLLKFTPYYRRFALRRPHADDAEDSPMCARFRDFFVPRGYAMVIIDVRGTGASF